MYENSICTEFRDMPLGDSNEPGALEIERGTSATALYWLCYLAKTWMLLQKWRCCAITINEEVGREVYCEKLVYVRVLCADCRKTSRFEHGWLFEKLAKFGYLGVSQIKIAGMRELEQIKFWESCFHLFIHFILSSHFISSNINTVLYRTIILPFVLCGCETWSVTLRAGRRLRVLENRVRSKILECG
jgi:hypothetical protein